MPPLFCIWNPESPRAVSFSSAVFASHQQWPQVLSWERWLAGNALPPAERPVTVRIESPGKHWEVEKALLRAGAPLMQGSSHQALSCEEVDALPDDPGWIHASRQHYLGLCAKLAQLREHFQSPESRWMQHPEDIAVMCDKFACQQRLADHGVAVPANLGLINGYDDLMARMDAHRCSRVFLKLCHGSSASGTVALERHGARIQAFSTARMSSDATGGTRLRNWRAVTRYEDLREIRRLVDAVCLHRASAERWIPKSGWQGRRFDVRVVVIAGVARHLVARLSKGPFTNLQSGARRAVANELRAHLGEAAFVRMCAEAEASAACFRRSLYAGVDIALHAHDLRPFVLEVNAWGDLLPGVLCEGRSTYDWEIAHVSAMGA